MKKALEKLPFYNEAVLPYHFAQSIAAGIKYHWPGRNLHVIGVTGTNGKTTTSFMIWKMLQNAGHKTGIMTTVAWGVDELTPELGHMTTVDAITLNRRIREIADSGAEYLVLEVTSHALAEFRTFGIPFEIAVFTNLTHEHLDYHKTFAKYREAKGKLFSTAKYSILNADDKSCQFFANLSKEYITYGIKNGDFRAESLKLTSTSINYSLHDIKSSENSLAIKSNIPGEFNVYNSMAAALVGRKLGLTKSQIEKGVASLKSVEGRMNIIDEGQPYTVIVDYAHAPDALEKVFTSIGEHKGRIISVHGGAGRRDPSTRPIRGAILGKYSDIVIITEDDSRDEDPAKIASAFITGAKKYHKTMDKDLFYLPDRYEAIKKALELAKKDDIVLILGKGHEKTILRADGPHDFSDIEVTRGLLRERK